VFGVGPMNLLKWVRLQQVQYVLQSRVRMESMGYTSIQDVAVHYGFRSRNHFARDYRQLFGEAPKKTLLRAAA
jgi:AraC family ethanolamine operon transcriptional activator